MIIIPLGFTGHRGLKLSISEARIWERGGFEPLCWFSRRSREGISRPSFASLPGHEVFAYELPGSEGYEGSRGVGGLCVRPPSLENLWAEDQDCYSQPNHQFQFNSKGETQ
jgi:hypothetical protein